jgi:hypothetical protein
MKKLCRKPKRKPYGAGRGRGICRPHDYCAITEVNPAKARQAAKLEISTSASHYAQELQDEASCLGYPDGPGDPEKLDPGS